MRFLKRKATPRSLRLNDLTAGDKSLRRDRKAYSGYTLIYHLLSFESASRVRLKVTLYGPEPFTRTITDIWPSANWY
ncbi:MAG: NADH-quinone oxidoreductase subunit C [Desulfatiglandales bacterium]|nr:NADH-quinone oxidoreductase subunit C [Desulfatiglandales bacterium]